MYVVNHGVVNKFVLIISILRVVMVIMVCESRQYFRIKVGFV